MSFFLHERVSNLRLWASSRIEWAKKQEDQYGRAGAHEALTERRVLEDVLNILDGKSVAK
jgi:hypothetical protein